jgi:hypothetical protein
MEVKTILRKKPKRSLLKRLLAPVGEISVLRTMGWRAFGYYTPYALDSSRVDYDLARALYQNTDDRYKLGAAFARPVINTASGFMGAPHFTHADPDADQELEQAFSRWVGKLLRINRNALRDGDVFVRIVRTRDRFDFGREMFDLILVPPEWVTPVPDPLNGGWLQLVIRTPVEVTDQDGRTLFKYTVTETLTRDSRTVEVDGRAPEEIRQQLVRQSANPWGFIPVVHFKNEAEETHLFGASDLEPIEPFLKAYHDVLLFAVQGSKMFSRPKVKFKLNDVKKFLETNFTSEEIEQGALRFDNRELFLLQDSDDVEFITADSGLSGITTLLKFLYFCIVDVSETPEFAFGTAVQSSKASVSEQMIPLARKIRRKRGQFEEYYSELASMYLSMWTKVENRRLDTYQVDVGWEEISPRNDQEVANTIKTLTEGLTTGIESGLLSVDAAAEFLREFVPSMLPWLDPDADDDERRRVARTFSVLQRLRDGMGLEREEDDPTPPEEEPVDDRNGVND